MNKIQVGFLVSYDYNFLKNSIPLVYEDADEIFLAIDANKKTWSGEPIEISDSFFEWLNQFDIDQKIRLYRDNFSNPSLSTMECEIIERKKMANKMGIGNWIIQLDADEYFIDFKRFVTFLKKRNHLLKAPKRNPIQICPYHVNLYKKTENGFLIVDKASKTVVATNYPEYSIGRKTNGRIIYVNFLIIHECLSRSRQELITKFNNWGHNTEVNITDFVDKWDSLDENNYTQMRNFFFLEASKWKKLLFVKAKNIDEFIKEFKQNHQNRLYKSNILIISKNIARHVKYSINSLKIKA